MGCKALQVTGCAERLVGVSSASLLDVRNLNKH